MSTVDKELGFAELAEQLSTVHGIRQWGRVIQVVGNLIEADAPTATLGAFAKLVTSGVRSWVFARTEPC